MTNRDFYNAIINGNIDDDVVAHAMESLTKLDERNNKRSSKSKEVNEPIKTMLLDYLKDKDFTLGTSVAKEFSEDYSTQKVIGLLNELVKSGDLEKCEVKVEKVGKRMAYRPI